MARDTSHMTPDMWRIMGGKYHIKISALALTVWVYWSFEGSEEKHHSVHYADVPI